MAKILPSPGLLPPKLLTDLSGVRNTGNASCQISCYQWSPGKENHNWTNSKLSIPPTLHMEG